MRAKSWQSDKGKNSTDCLNKSSTHIKFSHTSEKGLRLRSAARLLTFAQLISRYSSHYLDGVFKYTEVGGRRVYASSLDSRKLEPYFGARERLTLL